ncbi:MAG: fibrobacter succinogenes major paralogous domain-containing protein [Bacteroidota bacterium]|nr:fibrobacter succinogenes major paralogous domain-containing protein [Bacteroidota bacterium]
MRKESGSYILLICFLTLFLQGCKITRSPKVTTGDVTNIESTRATGGGDVTSDGYTTIYVRGVCWGTKKSPTIKDSRTTDGYGEGVFTSSITGLLPNTLYYVRAYATNDVGIGYGNQVTFTTTQVGLAVLTTTSVTGVTQTSAVTGGNVTNDGGSPVTERGVCYSTHTAPSILDSKTSNGTGIGSFTSAITGLTGNTKYYVRAYATNPVGTGYGQEVTFTTSAVLPTITTADPAATSTSTAAGGGTISNDGGSPVTARGVCWSTSANPTINNNKTSDGTGIGSFTSNITGLSPSTTYHVRAYATNSVGTAYGTDKSFTTDPVSVTDRDGNTYAVVRIGTQLWTGENLKTTTLNDGTSIAYVTGNTAWSNLTTPGYCWYNNNEIPNKTTYGALYNWYTVSSGKLCPSGWHVSTDDEWLTMENYLGGASPAGGKLKETGVSHWLSPNTGATNESGFTALPGGWRLGTGTFESITTYGYWWTSTESTPNAYNRKIQYNDDKSFRATSPENFGMSVRCIKN